VPGRSTRAPAPTSILYEIVVAHVAKRGNARSAYNNGGGDQMKFSTIVGYLIMAAAVAGVIVSLPEIKRYIKISTM
jgi:hypothetical protein